MKYTERWSKSRRKMADGGQVTPGEQATQLAESWRRATLREPPQFIAEADLPESFRNAQREGIEIGKQLSQQFRQEFSDVDFSKDLTSFSKETRQRLQEGQNRYAKLHEERTKEQRAVMDAFTRQNPRAQIVKDVAKARAEYEKNIAKYNENLAKARQALPQQPARAAELVSYKIHGSPFMARGTKEQRDRYIDDYNRKQRIAQLKRQKTARSKIG